MSRPWGPARRLRQRLLPALSMLVLPLVLSGCLMAPASDQSQHIAGLYQFFVAASAGVLALVWGLLTWSVLRYRRRGGTEDGSEPPQTRNNVPLEVAWTTGPAILVAVLFFFTVTTLSDIQARSPDPTVRLQVSGYQWGWRFDYPDEGVTVTGSGVPGPEIVLPAGEPIELSITSLDVIHSFYVPAFLAKYDAIPGREYVVPLTIEEPGVYAGQCAEFCGLYHAQMGFSIRAEPLADYQAWIAAQVAQAEQGGPA